MKSLTESLFDKDLIEKDIFDNSEFKKWINRPDILWFIYHYWESGEEDWLNDYMRDDWQIYKPLVDELLEIITNSMNKTYTWYMINFDQFDYSDEIKDKFADNGEFYDMMNDAIYEICKKATAKRDGISKTWFRGPLPKNSNVTALLQQLELPLAKPGKLSGGIFLTNGDTYPCGDTIIVIAFPRGIDKSILKLFDIK